MSNSGYELHLLLWVVVDRLGMRCANLFFIYLLIFCVFALRFQGPQHRGHRGPHRHSGPPRHRRLGSGRLAAVCGEEEAADRRSLPTQRRGAVRHSQCGHHRHPQTPQGGKTHLRSPFFEVGGIPVKKNKTFKAVFNHFPVHT